VETWQRCQELVKAQPLRCGAQKTQGTEGFLATSCFSGIIFGSATATINDTGTMGCGR
jgi:hypothetical protein